MAEIVTYEHHGQRVYALDTVAGKHGEHCLCYRCARFCPKEREANCPIANALYELCVEHGLVSPVYECPRYLDPATPEY